MKIRTKLLVIAALALSLGSCKKKEEIKTPAAPAVAVTPAPVPAATPPVTPAPTAAAVSMEDRAAKLGFVKYLPQDTEVVMAFHQGAKAVERIKSKQLWKLLEAEIGMGSAEGGESAGGEEKEEPNAPLPQAAPDAAEGAAGMAAASEATGPAVLFGTEFTVALGKSTGEQAANFGTINRRMSYFQMRTMAKAFAAAAKAGDLAMLEQSAAEQFGVGLAKDLLADPESGVGLIERLQMPPLYLAFRTTAAQRNGAAQQLSALIENLGMLGDMVEPVEVEKAGQKFLGQKISGSKIAAEMANERDELETMLEPAALDKLLAAIAKKDLVVVSGTLGDYVILFIGSSVEDLKFAADPAQSLLASAALAFGDAYMDKDLAAVIYGQKQAMDQMIAATGGLADMAGGLRDGLSGAEGLGDTRNLEALLRLVGERETALRKLAGNEALGVVALFDDGFKIESYGGSDSGAVNWTSPNKLAALGDSPDVVMFANLTTEAAHDEKLRDYLEALMETSYALALKVSEVKVADDQLAKFKEMAQLFDTQLRPDVVAMWDGFSGDFGGSLGKERACIVDLNGSVPTIPGIPAALIKAGKFPRISMVAPVTDRAKLAASWQNINASMTSLLAKVSVMAGKEIPMQKPISSEKSGYSTWFFPLPFFNDDFMPSVTVGDQWFAASTSKNQALDLLNKAAAGGPTRTGLLFTVNFKALQAFSRETLKLVEQNSTEIFGKATAPMANLKLAGKLIEAMNDLEKFTVHARREGGVLRMSVHLKTR